ncbi:hypothetical protein [Parasitella parasitica]|uniref:MutL C-terminal dimerisation domain-containing protein n=1 Tax=Parasitella parasitica TaxID=35722 RepID=A0A0B7N1B8_9FUNG|nr:hypothetical protein [Parasitella parasitica]
MYLDMFTEFHDFIKIKALLTKVINQFLDQAGFLKDNVDKEPRKKRAKVVKTGNSAVNPYVTHSVSSNQSYMSEQTEEQQQSDYLTWWDPYRQKMFYIDPNTGNSFLTPPPPPPSVSSQSSVSTTLKQNAIDRTHLKRNRETSSLDSLFKNNTTWPSSKFPFPESWHRLSKQDLKDAMILGQVDKKFIVIQPRHHPNKILIMIDQHAADERIKLEEMISTGIQSTTTTLLEPGIVIQLDSSTEYDTLQNDERILKCLKKWGIQILITPLVQDNISSRSSSPGSKKPSSQSRFFDTTLVSPHFHKRKIIVTHLPQLITERCLSDHSLLKSILRDHMYWIKEQTDEFAIFNTCPRGILEILKSRACRSAIMFNDILNLEECSTVVKNLSNCNFPFQCAHGRPSAVPIQLDVIPPVNTLQRQQGLWKITSL